ncbi:unnamed protein product, partial [Ixodes hexagonus]
VLRRHLIVANVFSGLRMLPREEPPKNAFAKFQQMDSSANKGRPAAAPNFRGGTGGVARGGTGGVARSASDIKEMLLSWCKNKTRGYAVSGLHRLSTGADGY